MIRSSCVARGENDTVGYNALYTVPTGYVFLLKSIVYVNGTPGIATVTFHLSIPDFSILTAFLTDRQEQGTTAIWEGWIVLNAGDHLMMQLDVTPVRYWVSGAVLPFNPSTAVEHLL